MDAFRVFPGAGRKAFTKRGISLPINTIVSVNMKHTNLRKGATYISLLEICRAHMLIYSFR